MNARGALLAATAGALVLVGATARADDELPPWTDRSEVPLPSWARSVMPNKEGAAFYAEAGRVEVRRGSAQLGARLPIFATKRAGGCAGTWILVGPLAWICSDVADYAAEEPYATPLGSRPWVLPGAPDGARPPRPGAVALPPLEPIGEGDDGLPYRYYFAGADGAYGFANLAHALDDTPDQELERGFSIAVVEERNAHGETWGKSKKGRWFSLRELGQARPFLFHGELTTGGNLDVGWVTIERAMVYAADKEAKAVGSRVRFEKVRIKEERLGPNGAGFVRIESEGEGQAWMRARDVARPKISTPPQEIGGDAATERWIDVDLASQTLVAYEGKKPLFATIVSTGKGPPRSETGTHPGVHRIWVKIFTTKMDNLDKDDVDRHYSIEDVPWVQFFDKAIALHGAFWHRDFGHTHSHGCVNLAPLDARWLFAFTGPHLPQGWTAAYPTALEPGTTVRVR